MEKTTFSRTAFVVLLLLSGILSYGQNFVPFNTRYDNTLKGDMLLIGNNILSVHPTNVFNSTGTGVNNTFPDNGSNANNDYNKSSNYLVNVDVDSDVSTFNSSSANLDIPNPTCYKIVYAGIYWGAVVAGPTPNDKVKFKLPGSSTYIDLTGIKVADINSGLSGSKPYVYYNDVTSLVVGLGFGNLDREVWLFFGLGLRNPPNVRRRCDDEAITRVVCVVGRKRKKTKKMLKNPEQMACAAPYADGE